MLLKLRVDCRFSHTCFSRDGKTLGLPVQAIEDLWLDIATPIGLRTVSSVVRKTTGLEKRDEIFEEPHHLH